MPRPLDFDGVRIGEEFGPVEYVPTAETISKYVEAVGDPHPWYSNSPFGGPIAPPTIAALFQSWALRSAFSIPAGTIHAKQEFEFLHPIKAGMRVLCAGKIEDKYMKRGRKYVEIRTRASDMQGRELVRSKIVMVLPSEKEEGEGRKARRSEQAVRVGEEIPPVTKMITQEVIERYAEASGDFNPIHIDPEFARRAGLGGTIAHGMLTLAYLSQMLMEFFGEGWVQGGHLSVTFLAPVRPGDRITARGTVVDAVREGQRVRLIAEIWCENQRGEKVIVGRAGGFAP